MWRCCSRHKVWYEWAVAGPAGGGCASPAPSPIHNPGGRSYHVGL